MYPAPIINNFLGRAVKSKIPSLVRTFLLSAPSIFKVLETEPVLITIFSAFKITSPSAFFTLTSLFDTKLALPKKISTFSAFSNNR